LKGHGFSHATTTPIRFTPRKRDPIRINLDPVRTFSANEKTEGCPIFRALCERWERRTPQPTASSIPKAHGDIIEIMMQEAQELLKKALALPAKERAA
jgi:hypothetical protein